MDPDTAYSAASGELFVRLDAQAVAQAIMPMAPLAAALALGLAPLLLMLGVNALANLLEGRGRRHATRRIPAPFVTYRRT